MTPLDEGYALAALHAIEECAIMLDAPLRAAWIEQARAAMALMRDATRAVQDELIHDLVVQVPTDDARYECARGLIGAVVRHLGGAL